MTDMDTAEAPEFPGACMCAEFAGHKALHVWGQPGCRYPRPCNDHAGSGEMDGARLISARATAPKVSSAMEKWEERNAEEN